MQALSRTNLTDTAVEAMRLEISSGRWPVGGQLPNEATLSSLLSVSRGTVREAVRVLVAKGFLETKQGSGTYVRSKTDPVESFFAGTGCRVARSSGSALRAGGRGRSDGCHPPRSSGNPGIAFAA